MPDPTGDHRTGRKLPRHYYTPGLIRDVEGVTRYKRDDRHDTFTGNAEALISTGVLTPEMLPAAGKCGISWRPTDRQPERGACWFSVPGYLDVKRRPDGTFNVLLAISDEEHAIRRAANDERDRRHVASLSKVDWPAEEERVRRERRAGMSADDLRVNCLACIEAIGNWVEGTTRAQMSVEYTESARHRIAWLLGELETTITGAQIVDRRHPAGGKGHLRVAWSAY